MASTDRGPTGVKAEEGETASLGTSSDAGGRSEGSVADSPGRINPRAEIDHANQDYLSGWALHEEGMLMIDVFVEDRRVGTATYGAYRADVSDSLPGVPEAGRSGFTYPFAPSDLIEAEKAEVSVYVVARSLSGELCTSRSVTIPTAQLPNRYVDASSPARLLMDGPAEEVESLEADVPNLSCASPFPVEVGRVLRLMRGEGLTDDRAWTAARVDVAVDDLITASKRASRDTAGLFWYFSYLREMWMRLDFNAKNFPALNRTPTLDQKDIQGVATSPIELFVICHHLATLRSHGVTGSLCEFGSFKGFSTAALSEACFRLGMTMDVFDSFEGLPESDSQLYRKGEFMGSYEEVRANVREFGNLAPVRFHRGFFSETVGLYDRSQIACLWMDVDLEISAVDAIKLLPRLDPRSGVFSDECEPEDFVAGRIIEAPDPDSVISPICNAFRADGRLIKGCFISGHTGFFRDEKHGIPVLMPEPLLKLKDALL